MMRVVKLPEVVDLIDSYKELMLYLTIMTGKEIQNVDDMLDLYNTLTSELSLGLELPGWANDVYASGILHNATTLYYRIFNWTTSLKRMQAGRLLRRIVDNMLDMVENHGINQTKIYLYSAHEGNVASALIILGLYEPPHVPKYTSAVIIELLSRDNEYYVRVRYYEGIPAESSIKTIPGCMELCPLQQFIELIEKNLASSEQVRNYC